MSKQQEKEIIFGHWNSKGIVVHKRITTDISNALDKALRNYTAEEVMALIDFYATILEPKTPDHEKKYFWTYRWGLWEFLNRGLKKFDGQDLKNYLRKQSAATPEAVVLKR